MYIRVTTEKLKECQSNCAGCNSTMEFVKTGEDKKIVGILALKLDVSDMEVCLIYDSILL